MSKNLYISVLQKRARVALTENGELIEFHVERGGREKIVGNIYRGKVMNVLSGMQAAFINIGLDKNAFLYVGDMLVEKEDVPLDESRTLSIRTGDEVMVQVVKDECGTKGARVTTDVSLPGRLLVLMPSVDYVGVSKKITDSAVKDRLFDFVSKNKPANMGFVVRTAAATASYRDIRADMDFLIQSWENIRSRYDRAGVAQAVHLEGDLIFRTMRDIYKEDIDHVYVNDRTAFEEVSAMVRRMTPGRKDVAVYFDQEEDIFDRFHLVPQIDSMLDKKVRLKNGAYLIIDKTEALTIIDINTGHYVGDSNLEETVFNTNILAAQEIAKQIRLRNIGGIIICDFIDMIEESHRDKVLEVLGQCLAKDRVRTSLLGMTGLGLVEITRKKTHNQISTVLQQQCPYCEGEGQIYSNDYISYKIRADLLRRFRDPSVTGAVVYVNPLLSDYFMRQRYFSHDAETRWADRRVYVVNQPDRHLEKFEIRYMNTKIFDLPEGAYLLY